MAQVVLDSNNLDAVVRDATGEGLTVPDLPKNSGVQTQIDAEATKILRDVDKEEDAPDFEERYGLTFAERQELLEGLTPEQRQIITDRLRKSVGKKHQQLKTAEEFAAEQYNSRRLAEAKAIQLERDLAAARAATAKPPEPPKVVEYPKRDQFKTDEEFRKAEIAFGVAEALKEKEVEDAKKAVEKREDELLAAAVARMNAARAAKPDFDELQVPDSVMIPTAVGSYLKESEMIGELSYYFKQHTDVLDRWCKQLEGLDTRTNEYTREVTKILVEVGKIESKLQPFPTGKVNGHDSDKSSEHGDKPSQTDTGTSPSVRSAPVIRPLSTGGASQVEKPEREMTAKEALAAYQKKKSINLTRRARH